MTERTNSEKVIANRWEMYIKLLKSKYGLYNRMLQNFQGFSLNFRGFMLRLSVPVSLALLLCSCGGGGSSTQQPKQLTDEEILENLNLSAPISYNNKIASNREKRLQIEIDFANSIPANRELRINVYIDSDGSGDESFGDIFIQLDNPFACAISSGYCYSSKTNSSIRGSYNEESGVYLTNFLSNLSYGATEDMGNLGVILGLHIFSRTEEEFLTLGNARYFVEAMVIKGSLPDGELLSTADSSDSYPDIGYTLMTDRYELDVERDYGGVESLADIRAVRVTNLLDDI